MDENCLVATAVAETKPCVLYPFKEAFKCLSLNHNQKTVVVEGTVLHRLVLGLCVLQKTCNLWEGKDHS